MEDFVFHNPTKIIFGRGKETQIGPELKAAGHSKVLLVYGRKSYKESGLHDRVADSLAEAGIPC